MSHAKKGFVTVKNREDLCTTLNLTEIKRGRIMDGSCTLALKACQRLFLELADFPSLIKQLNRKGVLTDKEVERVRGQTDLREQNKELIKALCENASRNFPLVIESLGDTPDHRCLQENLSTTLSKIQASHTVNLSEKTDIQLQLQLRQGRQQMAGVDDWHRLMQDLEQVIGCVGQNSARKALLQEYGLLVKSKITNEALHCQLQVTAKYNLIIRDVENGSMAQKIWSRLTQSAPEMEVYSGWSLSLQLPQMDKNLLRTLQAHQEDEEEEGEEDGEEDEEEDNEDPTDESITSHFALACNLYYTQGLIPQMYLSESQLVIQRVLEVNIMNKNCNLGQFYGLLRQCTLKANLITLRSEDGFSLLHEVIRKKRGELIKAFLYCGLLLAMYTLPVGNTGANYAGLTPVELADRFGAVKGRLEMEINMQIERNLQRYPIRIACRDGNVPKFRDLLRYDYPIGSATDNKSCLDWAIISGSPEMVNEVIEVERQRSHQRGHGADQITLCVQLGHSNMLEPLLNHLQVDLNSIDIDGKCLIEITAEHGDVEMFNILKSRGANVQDTVLATAAAFGNRNFILEMINSLCPPLNINFRDRRQKTALHFATERGHATIIELLVSRDADVTARDKQGRSILHYAAENGNVEVLKLVIRFLQERNLLQYFLTTTDMYLGSELCFLVKARDQEMPAWHYVHVDRGVLGIFRQGAVDVAQYGRVIKSGWGANPTQEVITEVESQFDMANISATAAPDMLPLHLAILNNNSDCAIRLIKLMTETSINKSDCFGLTPLHYACMQGDIKVITELERKHANWSATDSKGRNPAQIATVNNHPEVIEYFIQLEAVQQLLQTNIAPVMDLLNRTELEHRVINGENIKLFIRAVLRNLNSDINDMRLLVMYGQGRHPAPFLRGPVTVSASDANKTSPAQMASVDNLPEVTEYVRTDSLLGEVEEFLETSIAPVIDRLSMAELQRRVTNEEYIQQYIRTVLRDLNSDINNFLDDELQSGPVMEESQTQH